MLIVNLVYIPLPKIIRKKVSLMRTYTCKVCGYVYDEAVGDPDNGVAPGTVWADVPEDWTCPVCGASKEEFAAN